MNGLGVIAPRYKLQLQVDIYHKPLIIHETHVVRYVQRVFKAPNNHRIIAAWRVPKLRGGYISTQSLIVFQL